MNASPCLPGTQLKSLLRRLGIEELGPGCKCRSHSAIMDRQGCDWVESHIDLVVSWLRHEAKKRGLPFMDLAGRMLVKTALRRARRESAKGPALGTAQGTSSAAE
jgi:hypothetical protein